MLLFGSVSAFDTFAAVVKFGKFRLQSEQLDERFEFHAGAFAGIRVGLDKGGIVGDELLRAVVIEIRYEERVFLVVEIRLADYVRFVFDVFPTELDHVGLTGVFDFGIGGVEDDQLTISLRYRIRVL